MGGLLNNRNSNSLTFKVSVMKQTNKKNTKRDIKCALQPSPSHASTKYTDHGDVSDKAIKLNY